jgi:hypothetical protein
MSFICAEVAMMREPAGPGTSCLSASRAHVEGYSDSAIIEDKLTALDLVVFVRLEPWSFVQVGRRMMQDAAPEDF